MWNQHAPERRIWRVPYWGTEAPQSSPAATTALASLAARFRTALGDTYAFAVRHRCDGFVTSFAKAIETLDSRGEKGHGYHRDLAPDGCLPALATCLLDASQSAWVFGGMGSWNDMAFDGGAQIECDRVSEQLFPAVCDAIEAAANDSCAGDG
ncbi:MAG TPA: hypothetical protein VGZ23_08930 [bacterium]|nr:hypothetical protein [bacterium]